MNTNSFTRAISIAIPPVVLVAAFVIGCGLGTAPELAACAAVSRTGEQVVNADQTVVILWDAARKRQHFIRQASFKTDAPEDIGFIVPSPSRPELDESGDAAFGLLRRITAPPPSRRGGGFSIGCSSVAPEAASGVVVYERKRVAGFDAVVLSAESGEDLVTWLADNEYANSPAVGAWAKPYVDGEWYFTALKVARDVTGGQTDIGAAALRISFDTEVPLFPYREPDSTAAAKKLKADPRLLRIYFIADEAYSGNLGGANWGAKRAWSNDITDHRLALLSNLGLPETTAVGDWWLTEFEDQWPYATAPGDVYFKPSGDTEPVTRMAAVAPFDPTMPVAAVLALGLMFGVRLRRKAE